MKSKLCKIVYFDEESVTDYIQIVMGGKLDKTTELLREGGAEGGAGVQAKATVGLGATLKALMGIEVSTSVDSALQTSFNTHEMAKNIIKNTILTDFINIVEEDNKKGKNNNQSGVIKKFEKYAISVHKESLTYVALIAPYLSMLKGGSAISAGEFNIAIDKLDNTMKSAKGYYEFIGKKDTETVIFRYNIKSFKNNYKVTDLLKMNIGIYAIKVGTTTLEQLNFNSELDIDPNLTRKDNPSYVSEQKGEHAIDVEVAKMLDVYDVLLAGVESDD